MPTDTSKFDQALAQYIQYNRRELPVLYKKVAADINYEAGKIVGEANRQDIKNLKNQPWWVKFISKLLSKGAEIRTRKKQSDGTRKVIKEIKTGKGMGRGKYGKLVGKLSKQVIAARLKGVGLLSSAFYKAAKALKPTGSIKANGLKQSKGYADIQNSQDVYSITTGAIVYSPDADSQQSSGQRMDAARDQAILRKADDLMVYVHKKQAELAKQVSS
jgi:hypothetical protein